MSSTPIVPGKDAYTVGPALPAELPKPPFRPGVAGRIGFFFGPIAGAMVAATNLRRMGKPEKARKVRLIVLSVTVVLAVILMLLPDALGRILGFGMEVASYAIFPKIQDADFAEWQSTYPDIQPSNGWTAIGSGVLGLLVFLVTGVVVAMLMALAGVPIS